MELSHLLIVCTACITLVGIADCVPVETDFKLQMDILHKLGVTDPSTFPSVDLDNIKVPEHIRQEYESLQRRHRVRRAYISKGIHKNPEILGTVSFDDRRRQLFTFDLSDIAAGSEVIMAELKVYKERPNHSIFKPNAPGADGDDDHVHTALVSINQVLHNEVDMDADPAQLAADIVNQGDESSSVVVDRRQVALNSSGWTIFDVTNTIQTWVADPESNHGIGLNIDPIQDGHRAERVVNEIVFATEFHPDSADSRPVLIIYTTKFAPESEAPNECRYEGEENHRCCRRRKFVDFRDLSWTNRWIIEPAGFEAYECMGPCHNPRSRHIRDLFALPFFGASSPGSYGGSSTGANHRTCGISRSSALPMMYLSARESGVVELKVEEIPNMIVDDCHCTL